MVPVLKDEKLQAQFERDGYVRMKFLNEQQIKRLRDFYEEVRQEHEAAIREKCLYSTSDTGNPDLLNRVDKVVKEVMVEQIEKHFKNYQLLVSNYLIKHDGDDTDMSPHQDLLFVNEPLQTSFNVWVPLQDTGKNGGHLRILKGSQYIHYYPRVAPTYPWPFQALAPLITNLSTPVYTTLGDCIVLNHAVIHGSAKNTTGQPRVAAIVAMCSAPADVFYYHMPTGGHNQIDKYLMPAEGFNYIGEGGKPKMGTLVESLNYSFPPLSKEEFLKWHKERAGLNIFNHVRRLLNS